TQANSAISRRRRDLFLTIYAIAKTKHLSQSRVNEIWHSVTQLVPITLLAKMSYLKSILTYHIPSEADVDKSMLESHGITVNLLNANVARAEFGAPFHIRLQVPDEQVEEAVGILRELRPERFGSP